MPNARVCALSLLGMLASGALPAAQTQGVTTNELVQMALDRNRDLLASRERVAEAQALLRRAGVRPNPTVEIDYGSGRPVGSPGTDEMSLRYLHPIELGGKRGKRQALSEAVLAQAEAEVADRSRQIAFDVKTRAAELRASRAKASLLEDVLASAQEALRLTRARVGEGDAPDIEARLLAVEVARLEAQRATLRGRAAAGLQELRRAVGADGADLATVAPPPGDRDLAGGSDALRTRALLVRPDLRAARAAEQQGAAELALTRADGLPDLTASATYTQDTDTTDDLFGLTASGRPAAIVDRDKRLSVGISIPVFTPGRNRSNTDAAHARATAATLRREHLELAVSRDVDSALARWSAARDTMAIYRTGVVAESDQVLAVLREAYTLGQLRMIDVLNEQRRLVDTRLALIDAETELVQAAAELERAVGTELP